MPLLTDHRSGSFTGHRAKARRDIDDAAPFLAHHIVDEGPRQRHRRLSVHSDKKVPLLWRHLPEFDWALAVVGSDRRLSDPGIVDQNIDGPETAARLGEDVVNRPIAGEVGLDRHQVGAVLVPLCCTREIGETLGSSVGRSHGEPLAEQAQHNFLADTASGTGNDRDALLFAHRSLPLAFRHDVGGYRHPRQAMMRASGAGRCGGAAKNCFGEIVLKKSRGDPRAAILKSYRRT